MVGCRDGALNLLPFGPPLSPDLYRGIRPTFWCPHVAQWVCLLIEHNDGQRLVSNKTCWQESMPVEVPCFVYSVDGTQK